MEKLIDAVGRLIKAKGRFHTEQNYMALVAAYDDALLKELSKLPDVSAVLDSMAGRVQQDRAAVLLTVPVGYQLVPVEPTMAMIAALAWGGDEDLALGHAAISAEVRTDYSRMLAAAPQQAAPAEDGLTEADFFPPKAAIPREDWDASARKPKPIPAQPGTAAPVAGPVDERAARPVLNECAIWLDEHEKSMLSGRPFIWNALQCNELRRKVGNILSTPPAIK